MSGFSRSKAMEGDKWRERVGKLERDWGRVEEVWGMIGGRLGELGELVGVIRGDWGDWWGWFGCEKVVDVNGQMEGVDVV